MDCEKRVQFSSVVEARSPEESDDSFGEMLAEFASPEKTPKTPAQTPEDIPSLALSKVALARVSTTDACFVESVEPSNHVLAVQIRALSQEAFGKGEDAMQLRRGEHVAALLLGGEVCGYASYIVRRDLQSFSVHKLAVSEAHRRRGVGRILLRNLVQIAKRRTRGQPPLDAVCLSSLPTSVLFYKACGFHENADIKLRSSSEDVVEGQVYMEYRLQKKKANR